MTPVGVLMKARAEQRGHTWTWTILSRPFRISPCVGILVPTASDHPRSLPRD